jgi:hypothetical protein
MADPDVIKVIRGLRAQGAVIENRGKSMRRAKFPNGKYVDLHSTPSDNRWRANLKPRVEKAGAVWPLGDSQKLKAAIKANKAEAHPVVEVPRGHFDHLVMPASVRDYRPRKPQPKSIGLVRGALLALGNPETFWTDQIGTLLQGQIGFKGAQANIRTAQILDWLGYRTVEVKPNRNGHSYRWALDPESDRAKNETLPLIWIQEERRAEKPVDEDEVVHPADPGDRVEEEPSDAGGSDSGVQLGQADDLPAERPADSDAPEAALQLAVPSLLPVTAQDVADIEAAKGTWNERHISDGQLVGRMTEAEQAAVEEIERATLGEETKQEATQEDIDWAVSEIDRLETRLREMHARAVAAEQERDRMAEEVAQFTRLREHSRPVGLDVFGKRGEKIGALLAKLGLEGELRVWEK